MSLFLAGIVFLLGCCTGLLALIYRRRSRDADRVIEAMERLAEAQRTHVNAVATVMLNSEQQSAREILKELRKAARDRRELMDFVKEGSVGPDSDEPVSGSEPGGRASTTPGVSTLPPDAPTPQSGFPVGELLKEAVEGRE